MKLKNAVIMSFVSDLVWVIWAKAEILLTFELGKCGHQTSFNLFIIAFLE